MALSCSCDFEPSDFDTFWMDHSDFKPLAGKNRKRCCSCENQISISSETMEFYRFRYSKHEIEERIYGEYVPLAGHFMCEECAGLYLALEELGYGCLDVTEPMKGYIEEYNDESN